TGRIVRIAPFEAGEGNDARHTRLGAGVDRFLRPVDHFLVKLWIIEAAHEWRSRHAVGRDGTSQAELTQRRPIFRRDNLDRQAAKVARDLTGALQVPALAGGVEAPEDDRLANTAIARGLRLWASRLVLRQPGAAYRARHAGD